MALDQDPWIVEIPEAPLQRRVEGHEGEARATALEIRVVEPLSSEVGDLLGNRGQWSLRHVHRSIEVGIVVPPCALQLTRDPQRMPTSRGLGGGIPGEHAPETAQA